MRGDGEKLKGTDLTSSHKELKPLRESFLVPVGLGQGAHDLRMFGDERGMDDVVLEEFTDEGVQEPGSGVRRRTLQLVFFQEFDEFGVDLGVVERG